jgi:hypothetical protein
MTSSDSFISGIISRVIESNLSADLLGPHASPPNAKFMTLNLEPGRIMTSFSVLISVFTPVLPHVAVPLGTS